MDEAGVGGRVGTAVADKGAVPAAIDLAFGLVATATEIETVVRITRVALIGWRLNA